MMKNCAKNAPQEDSASNKMGDEDKREEEFVASQTTLKKTKI